jgi:hypothetical protein
MKYLPYGHTTSTSLLRALVGMLWQRTARMLSPTVARAVAVSKSPHARQLAAIVLLVAGLLLQLLLVLVVAYLIDLSISLMDLWVELARKHLEITL